MPASGAPGPPGIAATGRSLRWVARTRRPAGVPARPISLTGTRRSRRRFLGSSQERHRKRADTERVMTTAAPESHRVLVVDDEPNIADVISMALRFQGFTVESVGDGRSALEAVA